MLTVGLTGGIGSGKSEVARRFAALGAVIVDSDAIAHEVVLSGTPGFAAAVAVFGDEVVGADGELNREALAAIVFATDDARGRLNAIVHPLIGEQVVAQMIAASERDPNAIVVNDVPLLVEGGLTDRYDTVVVVDVPIEVQVRRLVEQRGMSETDSRARMAVQATREQRRAVADFVIDNSGDLDSLQAAVTSVWQALREMLPSQS